MRICNNLDINGNQPDEVFENYRAFAEIRRRGLARREVREIIDGLESVISDGSDVADVLVAIRKSIEALEDLREFLFDDSINVNMRISKLEKMINC